MDNNTFNLWYIIINAIIAIGTIAIAVFAFVGFKLWKKQLKGKVEFELSSKILKSFYKIRDNISYVRNPFLTSTEINQDIIKNELKDKVNNELTHKQMQILVYNSRLYLLSSSMKELYIDVLESKVYWGDNIEKKYRALKSKIIDLQLNIEYFLYESDNIRNTDKWKSIQEIIYEKINDKNDKYSL